MIIDVRQMELYEAEPVVLDPSPFEVKLIIQS
jgi:hypothetical protein